MNWDVIEVKSIGKRTLQVRFTDGLLGTVHLPYSFCTGVFQSLLDEKLFGQVGLENGAVVWPNGLDLAPDTMYQEIKRDPRNHYDAGNHSQEFFN